MMLNKKRILITDSEPENLALLKDYFASDNYDVTTESDSLNIKHLVCNEDFDLVLLDVSISALRPLNLIQLIFSRNIGTSIICVCDTANYDTGIEAIKRGASEVLVKPYDIHSLPDLFNSVIDRHAEECKLFEDSYVADFTSNIYKIMVESSQDVQYLLDENGVFLYVNKRVESLLGFRRSELLGQHYSMLIRHDDLMGWNYRFHDKKRIINPLRCTELAFNCKHNNVRYFDVTTIPLSNEKTGTSPSLSAMENNILKSAVTFGIAHDVTSRMKVEQTVYQKASYDYLTGLPNKLLFYDRLNMAITHAKRDKSIFSVMFLDLDDFKRINDSFGHSVGDSILIESAVRLRSCVRSGDTVARIGGDEFLILLPRVNNRWEAALIAKKFTDKITRPFIVDDVVHKISASIGISLYPDDGISDDKLIQSADGAMYEIKKHEKNGYKFMSSAIT